MQRLTNHILVVLGSIFLFRYILSILLFVIRLMTAYDQAVFVFQWAKYKPQAPNNEDDTGSELPPYQGPPLSGSDLDEFLNNLLGKGKPG